MQRLIVSLALAILVTGLAPGQEQKHASLGDFRLESGEVVRDCRIGYRTFGKLNAERSNAVLFPTWFTGTSADLAQFFAPGKLVDTSKHFVIAVDALGNGVSSAPSNSTAQPRLRFPRITVRDMVRSEHRLLTGPLGISHLRAVMGISMGGMQSFEWAVTYPGFMDKVIPIVGSPQLAASDLLLWQAEIDAIEEHRDYRGGEYQSPLVARALWAIHEFALATPRHISRQPGRAGFASHVAGAKERQRFDANNWVRQAQAMMAHDVASAFGGSLEKAAAAVRAKMLVIAADEDHMVNPEPAVRFARMAKAELLPLPGECGHLAPGCESAKLNAAVARFLD